MTWVGGYAQSRHHVLVVMHTDIVRTNRQTTIWQSTVYACMCKGHSKGKLVTALPGGSKCQHSLRSNMAEQLT